MKAVKIMAMALCFVFTAAVTTRTASAATLKANTEISAKGDDKKDKKKKDKKKKEKEVKTPEEILASIEALEWTKPEKANLKIDQWYEDADKFFATVKNVGNTVRLFKVVKVIAPDTTFIAPVDLATGEVRNKNQAFAQVMESAAFITDVALQATNLGLGAMTYADQIAVDAVPMVGNKARKTANQQIMKATKAFPMLKELSASQRNMMNRYFKQNANAQSDDQVTDAVTQDEIDFLETMDMTEEELNAYMAAEEQK